MTDKIRLVRGDTGPQIRLSLTDDITGEPLNLTGATVTLHFRAAGEPVALFSRQCYVNPQTASTGVAIVQWNEGDLDRTEGDYEGEVEVTYSAGLRQTVYDLLKFKLREDVA
jgi:hypothetical protein